MSLNKPHSLLSFIYNTTIDPPYRLEMHMDMQTAFDRFDVTSPPVELSCYGIEQAAYWLRATSNNLEADGALDPALNASSREQMNLTTKALFALLEEDLATKTIASANGAIVDPVVGLAKALDATAAGGDADAPWSAVSMKGGKVVVEERALLLEYAYFFLHFPEARAAILANTAVLVPVRELPGVRSDATIQAFKDLGAALAGNKNAASVKAAAKTLCAALQKEYELWGWPWCW